MKEEAIRKVINEKNLSDIQLQKINLYLEQIKYITAENHSIQEKFLSGVDVPLAALGILIYHLESEMGEVKKLYLIVPFFCLFIIYNLIKYTIRIFINNGYLQHLEIQINDIIGEKIFLMNQGIRNTSMFKKLGFAVLTSGAQIPIYIAIGFFLMKRFFEVCDTYEDIRGFATFLIVLLFIECVFLLMMGVDAIKVRKHVVSETKQKCEGNEI